MKNKGVLEKGTIYLITAIGIKKIEARDIEWSIGEFAQYANGIILKYKPKSVVLLTLWDDHKDSSYGDISIFMRISTNKAWIESVIN